MINKKLWVFSLMMISYVAQAQQFSIKGKFTNVSDPLDITLDYRDQIQTFLSKDGSFEFKGLSQPTIATLKVLPHHPKYTMEDKEYWQWYMPRMKEGGVREFFLTGNMTLDARTSLDSAIIQGNNEVLIAEKYLKKKNYLEHHLFQIRDSLMDSEGETETEADTNTDTESDAAAISPAQAKLRQQLSLLKRNFIRQHPDSYFSLQLVARSITEPALTFQDLLNTLSPKMRSTEIGQRLTIFSEGNSMNKIGHRAKNFTQYTMDGKEVTLDDFKGKYLLIDFWASWCIPCREENPNVVKAYNKFKNRNFDVLSISVDTKKAAWVKAVSQDKLPWTQVSEKQEGKNNSAAILYAIKGYPSNVLISPDGIIIAKDLRGAALEKELSKVLPAGQD